MDCATMGSDVIGDFQEPYRAVLVDGDDMAALLQAPSKAARARRERPAAAKCGGGRGSESVSIGRRGSIVPLIQARVAHRRRAWLSGRGGGLRQAKSALSNWRLPPSQHLLKIGTYNLDRIRMELPGTSVEPFERP